MSKLVKITTNLVAPKDIKKYQLLAQKIFAEKVPVLKGQLIATVQYLLGKKSKILALAKKHATPFYVLDEIELNKAIKDYNTAFKKVLPDCQHFYALKLNPHPFILKQVLKNGFGLDVSSGRELEIALAAGAKNILYSGPGKTIAELEVGIKNYKKTIINMDSFGEMERLGLVAKRKKIKVKAGIRIYTKYHGEWSKFGIALQDLKKFWLQCAKYPNIELQGIQFHMSFIKDTELYKKILKEVADYLKKNFTSAMLAEIKFIDFGGGFRPYLAEGHYPHEYAQGAIIKEINTHFKLKPKFLEPYYITEALPIADYAKGIAEAIDDYFRPLVNCAYFSEPGRAICNNVFHVVLKVVDIKSPGNAILDGGINIVGWERYEWDYFPVINLSRPSLREIKYKLYGSLCLPADIWSYYCYAKDVKPGDVILVPYQGALTYTLAQNFIKPIPEIYHLK